MVKQQNRTDRMFISYRDKKFFKILDSPLFTKLKDEEHKITDIVRKKCKKVGSFHYIPRWSTEILKEFIVLKKWLRDSVNHKNLFVKAKNKGIKRTFVDAGSGFGNILLLANMSRLSKYCTGIEFNKFTSDTAKEILNTTKEDFKLILDNIITYKKYAEFDIIYYYHPFSDPLLEVYFEEFIEDEASLGTIIIPKSKHNYNIQYDKRFTRITILIHNSLINKRKQHSIHSAFTFYIKTLMGPRTHSALFKEIEIKKTNSDVRCGRLSWKKFPRKYKIIINQKLILLKKYEEFLNLYSKTGRQYVK